jgi:cyanate permease
MVTHVIVVIISGGVYMGWGWALIILAIFALLLMLGIWWWLATDRTRRPIK